MSRRGRRSRRTEVSEANRGNLIVILGDQLNAESSAFDGLDRDRDTVWMAEVAGESTHVWSHKVRTAFFLSAMRHFGQTLRRKKFDVHYVELDDPDNRGSLKAELEAAVERLRPERLVVTEPGEWRVRQALEETASETSVPLEVRPDRHFMCSAEEFAEHAAGRKQLRMEYFYREMRRRYDVLMDGDKPEGGTWNLDAENRDAFPADGPDDLPAPPAFSPDATTQSVLELVGERFSDHPGSLERFDWPVTPQHAERALEDFIRHRLADFGTYQDAMWEGEPFLYHSLLSAALNCKLLDPRAVIGAAEEAYRAGRVPLNAAEGFIRQILGWREYVRGVYWLHMPDYLERNALKAQEPLPGFYWTADTDMNCLRQIIGQTLRHGYAHHIQRLMVTGLFSLLLGVRPQEVHRWYLAVYVDAVEWVELPNTLGMSQFADGGIMASKPYAATGSYIQRMSNYCDGCPYDPKERMGGNACPFTTLYWDFLLRHRKRLEKNARMKLQIRNLERLADDERRSIRQRARELKKQWAGGRRS